MKVRFQDNKVTLSGYVTVTARDSKRLPPGMTDAPKDSLEQIMPGTFQRAIENNPDVRFMYNHKRTIGALGENLQLSEDAVGLHVVATTDDPEVVKEARAGHLTGWSWGMDILHERPPDELPGGMLRRYVDEINLHEVSILNIEPASIATTVHIRAMQDEQEKVQEEAPDYADYRMIYQFRKERLQHEICKLKKL